jgi:hypothetical protein
MEAADMGVGTPDTSLGESDAARYAGSTPHD